MDAAQADRQWNSGQLFFYLCMCMRVFLFHVVFIITFISVIFELILSFIMH